MKNLHSKKAKRIISAVVCVLLVAAMILPTLAYMF